MTVTDEGHAGPQTVLFGHPESGHAYKVALALTVLNLPFAYRPIDPALPRADRPADWIAASRFGEIPVLLWRGQALVQSNAILLRLARDHDALGWSVDRSALTEWLFWEANRIGFSLPNLRHGLRAPLSAATADLAWFRARLTADLCQLDGALSEASFLLGPAVSVADIACSAYLFFADQIDLDLKAWPAVEAWLERIRSLAGWRHPYDLLAAR